MTKLMLEAIEVLRRLPEDQQDEIARAVMLLAGEEGSAHVLTAEEQADIDEVERELEDSESVSGERRVGERNWMAPSRQLSVEDIRLSVEEARANGRTIPANEVFDRLEARLKTITR